MPPPALSAVTMPWSKIVAARAPRCRPLRATTRTKRRRRRRGIGRSLLVCATEEVSRSFTPPSPSPPGNGALRGQDLDNHPGRSTSTHILLAENSPSLQPVAPPPTPANNKLHSHQHASDCRYIRQPSPHARPPGSRELHIYLPGCATFFYRLHRTTEEAGARAEVCVSRWAWADYHAL